MSEETPWLDAMQQRRPARAAKPTPPEGPVSSLQRVASRLEQIADTFDQLAEQLRSLAELVME